MCFDVLRATLLKIRVFWDLTVGCRMNALRLSVDRIPLIFRAELCKRWALNPKGEGTSILRKTAGPTRPNKQRKYYFNKCNVHFYYFVK